ncbi:uncharacterized protein LOC124932932 [Impatiens glandulifera]|uniref:uncharacterized protein LOC124932932 n=1 Tax=Impatiens glandulifera TaxID=253017 RepID=UPI001FB0FE03|nr:uncharacterized protein LOC124932932 [Impatiens glandulifera]
MDKDQDDIQFIGLFGIYKESLTIINSWRNSFAKIALATILPLSVVFLAHIEISELLFSEILHNEDALDETRANTPRYAKLSHMISSEWTAFWIFKFFYFIFFLILSLLSTSAIVYTIACIYTAKSMPSLYELVTIVVPRVWKRLIVTFLWNFVIIFMYNVIAVLTFILWGFLFSPNVVGIVVLCIMVVLYLTGFVYINVIWHLASVVSVLEDVYGIQAMIKSKALIKGKMRVAAIMFLTVNLLFLGVQIVYQRFVVLEASLWLRLFYGMICLNFLVILILLGLVIQTVIYFICKSYHHENIDKLLLSDHLEAYLGHYVPLKSSMDVQLEQFQL